MARSLGRSLVTAIGATNIFAYIGWLYRVATLVLVVVITLIQLEVHSAALEGTETGQTAFEVTGLIGIFFVMMAGLWLAEVAVKTWRVYTHEERGRRLEVSDVE